jgi:predicted acyl esterase
LAINIADGVARTPAAGRHILEVRVGSVGAVFRAGHRIRIQVAGSNFPRLERSPGAAAIHSLFTGSSRLRLPIVELST